MGGGWGISLVSTLKSQGSQVVSGNSIFGRNHG